MGSSAKSKAAHNEGAGSTEAWVSTPVLGLQMQGSLFNPGHLLLGATLSGVCEATAAHLLKVAGCSCCSTGRMGGDRRCSRCMHIST